MIFLFSAGILGAVISLAAMGISQRLERIARAIEAAHIGVKPLRGH